MKLLMASTKSMAALPTNNTLTPTRFTKNVFRCSHPFVIEIPNP